MIVKVYRVCIGGLPVIWVVDMESTSVQYAAMAPNDRQISVRLPLDLLARCEAMQAALEQHPQLGAFTLSRNGVIKLALAAGLEALEAEHGVTRPGGDDGER